MKGYAYPGKSPMKMDTDVVKAVNAAKQSEVDAQKKSEKAKSKGMDSITGLAKGALGLAGAAAHAKKGAASPAKLKDDCYYKAKAAHKVFPSAYASGMIAKCRKKKGGKK